MSNSPLVVYTLISPHKAKRTMPIDMVAIHCLPMYSTELLTPNGWVMLSDLKVGDTVATCDDRLNIMFDKVQNIVTPRKDIVFVRNGVTATANHRMLSKGQSCMMRDTPWKTHEFNKTRNRRIPCAGNIKAGGLGFTKD